MSDCSSSKRRSGNGNLSEFRGGQSLGNYPVANATNLGSSGKLFVYAGYGYRVNGSFSQIYLDEILTAAKTLRRMLCWACTACALSEAPRQVWIT